MADKNKTDSTATRAGRWFARLLGRDTVEKLRTSAHVLKEEYAAGKQESEEPPARPVPHRVVDSEANSKANSAPNSAPNSSGAASPPASEEPDKRRAP